MILVLNAGSSSLKFAVFGEGLEVRHAGQVAGLGTRPRFIAETASRDLPAVGDHAGAIAFVLAWLADNGVGLADLGATGHRIVHGGTLYTKPTRVDDKVFADLERLRALAPLHLPFGLAALAVMRESAPRLPQIACFDTAFHASQPEVAVRLPLPRAYHERGYRRYGFHGLNYEHVLEAMTRPLPRRLLAAHLGSGASMCAILDGRSIATTMGYSTADGLVMGTRTGAIDPGVLIALMRDDGLSLEALEDLLYRRSGLLGLSGLTGDMRQLLESRDPRAAEAVDYYCYWAARQAGGLIAVLGGIDALVFTGGVGENAAPVRDKIAAHLAWLGVGGKVPIHIVAANEELTIARHTRAVIADD